MGVAVFLAWLTAARAFAAKLPWQVCAALGIILSAWLWGNHRYSQGVHHERAKWEELVAKAKAKEAESERRAQANHETREEGRRVSSDALRQKADEAPEGSKTKAVLDGLRKNPARTGRGDQP